MRVDEAGHQDRFAEVQNLLSGNRDNFVSAPKCLNAAAVDTDRAILDWRRTDGQDYSGAKQHLVGDI